MGQRWIGSDALDSIASVRRRWPIGVTEMLKSEMTALRQFAGPKHQGEGEIPNHIDELCGQTEGFQSRSAGPIVPEFQPTAFRTFPERHSAMRAMG